MILIADSGSTKTEWKLIGNGLEISSCITSGINPFFLEKEEILHILNTEFLISKDDVSSVFFYGAGCIPAKVSVVSEALSSFFETKSIEVNSDLLAAARSLCQNQEGIACILGTGSNSCYYDGKEIAHNVSPLGFILGDEGSGAVLGKKLIADILKNQLPETIRNDFFFTYPVTAGDILEHVYRKPFPNRYLAQYTKFIAKHMDCESIKFIVETSFNEFVARNLLQYQSVLQLPIHFTGSIAFYFQEIMKKVLEKSGLKLGKITQSPMEGLVEYHLLSIKN